MTDMQQMAYIRQMTKIVLVAESGSDIPAEVADVHGIHIVPMHVSFGAEAKDDGTFPSEEICAYYERTGVLPQTSGCTPEDFNRVFDQIHANDPDAHILHLAYSAATTCSYQSAKLAAAGRDYVTSVDTRTGSAGQYAVVLRLARLLQENPEWTLEKVISTAESLIGSVRMCYLPDKLEYLRAGGRVSNAAAMSGRLLGIRPLIEVLDGKLQATGRFRGKQSWVIPRLTQEYVLNNDLEQEELWMLEAPGLSNELKRAAECAACAWGYTKVTWVKSGGVITAHGGPGGFGIAGFARDSAGQG